MFQARTQRVVQRVLLLHEVGTVLGGWLGDPLPCGSVARGAGGPGATEGGEGAERLGQAPEKTDDVEDREDGEGGDELGGAGAERLEEREGVGAVGRDA